MDIGQNYNKNLKKSVKKQMSTLPPNSKFIFQQLLKNSHHIEENLENETMVEYNVGDLKRVIKNILSEDEKEELQEKWWVSKYSKCNCECTIYFDEADGSTTKTTYKCCCNSSNAPCKKKRECPKRKGYDFLTSGTAEEIPDESIISVQKLDVRDLEDTEIEGEMDEATTTASSGAYETPKFWAKGKKNHRFATKRWMPDSKYVKVKDKCKKFPYCNQGDINALEIWEKSIMRESAKNVAKKTGKSESEVREMIEKEISEIIRRSFYKSPVTDLVGGAKMNTPIGKIFTMSGNKPKYES